MPRYCARLTEFLHPKLRKINSALIPPQPIPLPLRRLRCAGRVPHCVAVGGGEATRAMSKANMRPAVAKQTVASALREHASTTRSRNRAEPEVHPAPTASRSEESFGYRLFGFSERDGGAPSHFPPVHRGACHCSAVWQSYRTVWQYQGPDHHLSAPPFATGTFRPIRRGSRARHLYATPPPPPTPSGFDRENIRKTNVLNGYRCLPTPQQESRRGDHGRHGHFQQWQMIRPSSTRQMDSAWQL